MLNLMMLQISTNSTYQIHCINIIVQQAILLAKATIKNHATSSFNLPTHKIFTLLILLSKQVENKYISKYTYNIFCIESKSVSILKRVFLLGSRFQHNTLKDVRMK